LYKKSIQNGLKNLNVRLKTTREKHGKTLKDIGADKDFLNRIPSAQEGRARIDKWDYIQLKYFCTSKETIGLQGRKSLPAIHLTRD
jgi:hypothetical protein